jgi:superfamily II DNA/RNA helicase
MEHQSEVVLPRHPHSSRIPWDSLYLRPELQEAVRTLGYQLPSEIQARALPRILEGSNVLCQAKAGQGKTAAFVLGLLNDLALSKTDGQLLIHQAIIVTHTRELAYQISLELQKFSRFLGAPSVRVGCYFGGLSVQRDL